MRKGNDSEKKTNNYITIHNFSIHIQLFGESPRKANLAKHAIPDYKISCGRCCVFLTSMIDSMLGNQNSSQTFQMQPLCRNEINTCLPTSRAKSGGKGETSHNCYSRLSNIGNFLFTCIQHFPFISRKMYLIKKNQCHSSASHFPRIKMHQMQFPVPGNLIRQMQKRCCWLSSYIFQNRAKKKKNKNHSVCHRMKLLSCK